MWQHYVEHALTLSITRYSCPFFFNMHFLWLTLRNKDTCLSDSSRMKNRSLFILYIQVKAVLKTMLNKKEFHILFFQMHSCIEKFEQKKLKVIKLMGVWKYKTSSWLWKTIFLSLPVAKEKYVFQSTKWLVVQNTINSSPKASYEPTFNLCSTIQPFQQLYNCYYMTLT